MIQFSAQEMVTTLAVYGCSECYLCQMDEGLLLHKDVVAPWQALVETGRKAGFEPTIASGYRSFERQLAIWNGKLNGQRPVLDEQGCELNINNLSPLERIEAVMRWSAVPGASRHHWGTDIDIYDRAAIDENYQLQLVPEEYEGNGPFTPMMQWLKGYLAEHPEGFYHPYLTDCGGVKPEPWHLSYRPVAEEFESQWQLESLSRLLSETDIAEGQTLQAHLLGLYQRYILGSVKPSALNQNS